MPGQAWDKKGRDKTETNRTSRYYIPVSTGLMPQNGYSQSPHLRTAEMLRAMKDFRGSAQISDSILIFCFSFTVFYSSFVWSKVLNLG